jgi:hypothetical protein
MSFMGSVLLKSAAIEGVLTRLARVEIQRLHVSPSPAINKRPDFGPRGQSLIPPITTQAKSAEIANSTDTALDG